MRRRSANWSDVVVTAILMLLLVPLVLAQAASQAELAARVHCASNLRQLGQAMLLYSNDNRGAFPRSIAGNPTDPKPTWGTPYEGNDKLIPEEGANVDAFDPKKSNAVPSANDVTAALFLLLRTQDITSEVFVCPSTGSEKWNYGGGTRNPLDWTNWPGKKALAEHLSYSFQNPYPSAAAIGNGFKFNNTLGAEFAVLADMNPGVDALTRITAASRVEKELAKINSPNHAGAGQNVLFGDGHVSFEGSPHVGVNFDNIYTYGDSGGQNKDKAGDGIVGSPVGPDDSILLPTARDLGIVNADGALSEAAKKARDSIIGNFMPGTAEELAAAHEKLIGSYTREEQGRKIKLQITKEKLTANSGPLFLIFDYKVDGVSKSASRLTLTAPNTEPTQIGVSINAEGVVIKGNPYLDGEWKKQ